MQCIQFSEKNKPDRAFESVSWINLGTAHYMEFVDIPNLSEFNNFDTNNGDKKNHYITRVNDDELFWNNANKTSLLIIRYVKSANNTLEQIKDALVGKQDFQLYRSMDDYDFVLFHYTNDYGKGMDEVSEKINKCDNILSTYTIVAIRNDLSVLETYKENIINKVRIKIKFNEKMKNQFSDFSSLFLDSNQNLKKTYKKVILRTGNNDCEITFHEISTKDVLEHIMIPLLNKSNINYRGNFLKNFDVQFLYSPNNINSVAYRKNTYKLKKNIDDFRFSPSTDDLDMKLIENYVTESLQNCDINTILLCLIKSYSSFLLKIKSESIEPLDKYESNTMFCEGSMHLINLHKLSLMQKRNFLWEEMGRIPVKLLGIYQSVIDILKSTLQEDASESYTFLILPSKITNISVSALLASDQQIKNRLLLVRISSKEMSKIKSMFFNLAHEVAHYVPQSCRCREFRAQILWQITLVHISDKLFGYKYTDSLSECILHLNKVKDEGKKKKEKKGNIYLRDSIEKLILDTVIQSQKDLGEIIFSGRDEDVELWEIQQYYETFSNAYDSLEKQFPMIMQFLDECFSDIVAILTLDAKFSDYYNILCEKQTTYISDERSYVVEIRIALVYLTLIKLEIIDDKFYSSLSSYIKSIIDEICLYQNESYKAKSCTNLIFHPQIILKIIEYLVESGSRIKNLITTKINNPKLVDLREIFRDIDNEQCELFDENISNAMDLFDKEKEKFLNEFYNKE